MLWRRRPASRPLPDNAPPHPAGRQPGRATLRAGAGRAVSSLAVTALVFLCLCVGAGTGMALRAVLPEHHLSQSSTDVIKLATGLLATLAALVLSLLISSANTSHYTIESEYRSALASIALLDRHLVDYGPETATARELLRHAVIRGFENTWPDENFGPPEPASAAGRSAIEAVERSLLGLSPRTDGQKWLQSQSLQLLSALAQVRLLLIDQQIGPALPVPFLVVLIAWTTAIFLSFGLFAQPNATIVGALLISALAVAGAIFMIIELGSPFTGLIQISSAPAHATLVLLGQ
jgi:hypothetical protein